MGGEWWKWKHGDVLMTMYILSEHLHTHTHTTQHSPIVAFGLVLSPSMLGPSSGSGSHGREMFTCKSKDNDVVKFMCYGV